MRWCARECGSSNLPNALVDPIYERTGGVPLFVEEFTKMVQDAGMLERVGDDGVHAPALVMREIPTSLQDLLMARLDRMGGDHDGDRNSQRHWAASSATSCSPPLADMDESTLLRRNRQAGSGGDSLSERSPAGLHGTSSNMLCSWMPLYNSLVKERRHLFHRRIAEALETRFPPYRRRAAGADRAPLRPGGPRPRRPRLLAEGGPAISGAVGRPSRRSAS